MSELFLSADGRVFGLHGVYLFLKDQLHDHEFEVGSEGMIRSDGLLTYLMRRDSI